MASDNHARYSRIGFVVVAGAVAIAATLVYLGGFHDKDSEFLIETYYDDPVSGLSVGSPVNMRGVKIGEVRSISFAFDTYCDCGATTADYQRVDIVMACRKDVFGAGEADEAMIRASVGDRVARGLRATVVSSGITGLSRIELNALENPPPCADLGWRPRYPLVPPSPSLFESLSVAATKLLNRMKKMDFVQVWSNVNRTADSAARTAANLDAMVDSQRAGIASIVRNVEDVTASLKTLSEDLRQNPSLLLRENDPRPLPETAR